jgi:hypothetical protein
MRERYATCGREVNSTVFANDMAEGIMVFAWFSDSTRTGCEGHAVTCDVSRQGSMSITQGLASISSSHLDSSVDDGRYLFLLYPLL